MDSDSTNLTTEMTFKPPENVAALSVAPDVAAPPSYVSPSVEQTPMNNYPPSDPGQPYQHNGFVDPYASQASPQYSSPTPMQTEIQPPPPPIYYDMYSERIHHTMDEIPPLINDPLPHQSYWATPESLSPQNVLQNSNQMLSYHGLGYGIAFWISLLLLIISFIIGVVASRNVSASILSVVANFYHQMFSWNWFLSIIAITITILFQKYFTAAFANHSTSLTFIVAMFLILISFMSKRYVNLYFIFLTVPFYLVYVTITSKDTKLGITVLNHFNSRFLFDLKGLITPLVYTTVITILGVFLFYSTLAISSYTNWITRFFDTIFVGFIWFFITGTIGNIVYMMSARKQLGTIYVGPGFDNSFSEKLKFIWYWSGTAAECSFTNFFAERFRMIVNFDAGDLKPTNPVIALMTACISWVVRFTRPCFVNLLRGVDSAFTFPDRVGLVPCALYGIEFKEGSSRWAELQLKRDAGVIYRRMMTRNLFVHWAAASAFIVALTMRYVYGTGGAVLLGFAGLPYALLYVAGMHVCGAADAMAFAFAEAPSKVDGADIAVGQAMREAIDDRARRPDFVPQPTGAGSQINQSLLSAY